MEWWGPSTTIEFIDQSDELVVRSTSVRRKGDLLLPSGLLVISLIALALGAWALCVLGAALFAVFFLFAWFQTQRTELLITATSLSSRTSSLLEDKVQSVRWSEIRRLEYSAGGEDEPTGLYARKSFWTSYCLIPSLCSEETDLVINRIYSRFPDVAAANEPEGAETLFGRFGATISLNLSRRDK